MYGYERGHTGFSLLVVELARDVIACPRPRGRGVGWIVIGDQVEYSQGVLLREVM